MQRPTMSDVLSESWTKYKNVLGYLIGMYFVIWGISWVVQIPINILSTIIDAFGSNSNPDTTALVVILVSTIFMFLFWLVSIGVSAYLGVGERNILLAATDDKQIIFSDLFKPKGMFWRYLGATLLVGLIVFGGFLLFIIPGIYFAIRFMFVGNAIVDKRIGVGESLSYSSKLTLNNKWYLIGWGFLMLGINILGFLALFIGLIFTIPFTALASMVLYRHLTKGIESQAKTTDVKQPAKVTQ